MRYLKYIPSASLRREEDEIVVVSVYLKRSGVFKTLKQAVAQACISNNNTDIKKFCLQLMEKFNGDRRELGIAAREAYYAECKGVSRIT